MNIYTVQAKNKVCRGGVYKIITLNIVSETMPEAVELSIPEFDIRFPDCHWFIVKCEFVRVL